MCFDVSYLRKSCNGCKEFLRVIGTGGTRSRLIERSFRCNELSVVYNPQGFEGYIHPSNGSRRVDMVTREVRYKSSRRGGEKTGCVNPYC